MLIAAIERIFLDVEALHLLAGRLGKPRQARVGIAGLSSFTQTVIPVATAAFRLDNPSIAIDIYSLQADEVVDRVASGKVDLGVIQSGGDPSVVETLCSFQTRVVCAMHPSHPLAASERIHVAELKDHDVISYHLNEPSTLRMAEVFREAGEALRPKITVSNASAAVALAERGLGVALITPMVLSSWPSRPPVVLRDVVPEIHLKLRVIGPIRRSEQPEVQAFAVALREAARELIGVAADDEQGEG
ncbi:MAG: LysR substrate-binding domain-containing protein [Burkholderiaceae bacterium]